MYSVRILNENGQSSFLSVKGRDSWKTKKTALKHAQDMYEVLNGKNKYGGFRGAVALIVETDCADEKPVKIFEIL